MQISCLVPATKNHEGLDPHLYIYMHAKKKKRVHADACAIRAPRHTHAAMRACT